MPLIERSINPFTQDRLMEKNRFLTLTILIYLKLKGLG